MYRAANLQDYLEATYIPARLALTEGSAEQLRVAVRRYSSWLGRPALLSDLDAPRLVSWLRAQGESLAPSTVNSRRADILAIWNDAADAGVVEPPPRRGLPSGRRWKFHCLRRSSESHAAAVLGVAATAEIVGHSEAVARRHYIAPSVVQPKALIDVLPRF